MMSRSFRYTRAIPGANRLQAPAGQLDVPSLIHLRESELEEARNLQLSLLPNAPLRVTSAEFTSRFRAAAAVGGDFLDYFHLSDNRIGIYLGDVVGKGLSAAMYAALTVGTLRGIHKTGCPPMTVLSTLNRRLRTRAVQGRYSAVQYAVYDPETRELLYANAGLPRPIHFSNGSCHEVGQGGLPSGLFDEAQYEQYSVILEPGDALLFLTDGLIEAHDAAREEFGTSRVMEICKKYLRSSADDLLGRLFSAVEEFSGHAAPQDDITAALLKAE
jgi:sigma-B regulation protein RsbU (phosphoserine phosphatase)